MLVTPKDYPRHSNCSLLVTVNDDYLVALNFSLLERQNNDVIEIYDGKNEMATLLARYPPIHGDEKNGSLLSSSSIVYVVLKYGRPSIDNSYTKFVLNYTSEPKPTTTGTLVAIGNVLNAFIFARLQKRFGRIRREDGMY